MKYFICVFFGCLEIACFLDPETFFAMNDDLRNEAEQHIIAEVRRRNTSPQTIAHMHTSLNTNDDVTLRRSSSSKVNQLNNFLTGCGLVPPTTGSIDARATRTIHEEISYYLNKINQFTVFEEFWITYEAELPQLAVRVRSFNIRPASSVASESLFSVAAYVNRKQRCSLSPDALRCSMILRDADVLASLL